MFEAIAPLHVDRDHSEALLASMKRVEAAVAGAKDPVESLCTAEDERIAVGAR